MPKHALFLCTGNSARSILSEALTTHLGQGAWVGHSAGSKPTGQIHPGAIAVLNDHAIKLPNLRTKSWDEFAAPDAPQMDLIITVCDNAAGETCPIWPGHPATAHWGLPDPAAAAPDDIAHAFQFAFTTIHARIKALMSLTEADLASPDQLAKIAQIQN